MRTIFKYPRTPHLAGSRLGPGDEDLDQFPWSALAGRHTVVEEKLDGANCALSFSSTGELWLQSRGHYLEGGPRERQFELFKAWANRHAHDFFEVFSDRYIVYGEWTYAKHTIYYDHLAHYFHEFDILDTENMVFLDTASRKNLIRTLKMASVPILYQGDVTTLEDPLRLLSKSLYKSQHWSENLGQQTQDLGLNLERVLKETDPSHLAEGLYLKVEEGGTVVARFKWVRQDFLQSVQDSGSHWQDRPLFPNRLAPGVDLFC